jgi:ribosomal protein L11 methyltransferase
MPTRYILFKLRIHDEHHDDAAGLLSAYPIEGIEVGMDLLSVCFTQSNWKPEFESAILSDLAAASIPVLSSELGTEEDQNWNAEWEKSIDPVVVNERIVILPEWRADEHPEIPMRLIITPKMSFGTGHHATTRMMCRLMEDLVEPGSRWIDVGTGTGVLAILAVKLGASHVYAFDNSEWSVINAQENIERNDTAHAITLEEKGLDDVAFTEQVDGIAANLYRHLVIPYAPTFVKVVRPGGVICVSGILKYDIEDISDAFRATGAEEIASLAESEWCALAFRTPRT